MTCQDNCLYYPLCRDSGFLMYSVRTAKTLTLTKNVEKECPFKKFKNKADFVEVVRCRDCDRANRFDNVGNYQCRFFNKIVKGIHYCSYGERKGENNVKRNA